MLSVIFHDTDICISMCWQSVNGKCSRQTTKAKIHQRLSMKGQKKIELRAHVSECWTIVYPELHELHENKELSLDFHTTVECAFRDAVHA